MIKLTGERNEVIYVAPELVASIRPTSQGNTGINLADGYAIVTESPEEVVRKIMEYKLAMARYSMTSALSLLKEDGMSPGYEGSEIEWELQNLAGLEAKQDD